MNGPLWGGEPNTGEPNTSNYNNNDDAAPNDWVDQSWQSNAPITQATTRTNQPDSYYYNDDDQDYGDLARSLVERRGLCVRHTELVNATAQLRYCAETRIAVAAI